MYTFYLFTGPFTSDWSVEDGLAYLKNMKIMLKDLKDKDEKLRADLAIFGLSYDESVDLAKLENVRETKIVLLLHLNFI